MKLRTPLLRLFLYTCVIFMICLIMVYLYPSELQKLKTHLTSQFLGNDSIPSEIQVTSFKHLIFRVANEKSVFTVGDTLDVEIIAKDFNNETLLRGGDIFSLVLVNQATHQAMSGRVVDNGDGTYTSQFPLYWEGTVYIEGQLLMSSAVADYVKIVQQRNHILNAWMKSALYEANGRSTKVSCDLQEMADNATDFCDLTTFNGMEPWYCPKDPDFDCGSFASLRKPIDPPEDYDKYVHLFNTSTWSIDQKLIPLEVKVSGNSKFTLEAAPSQCPLGAQDTYPAGYFENQKWISRLCQLKENSELNYSSCLSGKHFLFYGDSNALRLKNVLINTIGGLGQQPNSPGYETYDFSNIKTKVQYIPLGHGALRWPQPGYQMSSMESVLMHPKEDVSVIFLSIWAHFAFHTRSKLLSILLRLRSLLLNWKAQYPHVEIFLRSPHYRNTENPPIGPLIASNWGSELSYNLFNLVFKNTPFHVINIWDMMISWRDPYDIHPHSQVMMESFRMMMSRLCH